MSAYQIRRSWALLALLLAFEVASLVGFATLGLHPEWLDDFPRIAALRPQVFSCFAQLQLYSSVLILVLFLYARSKWRWLAAFFVVFTFSLALEYCGTCLGIPFGDYRYSDLLGFSIAGRVPIVVPLSWFAMGLASYLLSAHCWPAAFLPRQLSTAALLTVWDLVLDPAMTHVTNFWYWSGDGFYYGVPSTNLIGWILTGVGIAILFEYTHCRRVTRGEAHWIAGYYLVNFLLPLGMMLAAGLWFGVLLAISGLVLVFYVPRKAAQEQLALSLEMS